MAKTNHNMKIKTISIIFFLGATLAIAAQSPEDLLKEMKSSLIVSASIHEAAIQGDVALVQLNLFNDASPDLLDEAGNTALHYAANADDADCLEVLVLAGGDVRLKNAAGLSASDLAKSDACKKVIAMAEGLRERALAVCAAILQGDTMALEAYLAAKGNPNAKSADGSFGLLSYALSHKQLAAAKMLIKAGAKTNAAAPEGKNILMLAASVGDAEIIKLIVNDEERLPMGRTQSASTPLHEAVLARNLETLHILLPYFERMNFNPSRGNAISPLALAMNRNDVELVKLFLAAGMKVKTPTEAELEKEQSARQQGGQGGQGGPPNGMRMMPIAPLIDAVKSGHKEMVLLMLEAGADKAATDSEGKTAADYASGELLELVK